MAFEDQKDNQFFDIGIDAIGFAVPYHYLSLEELAVNRKTEAYKYLHGLMAYEMRVPLPNEDIISLAIKAAHNALVTGKISTKSIDALFIGTETITYAVKSVSNILKDLLNLSNECLTQDVYNACAAGTLAIMNAISMIESGLISKAMVIAVDISSYPLNSPGEPTQGAGAVSLIISKEPRLISFGKKISKISGNITDFYRFSGDQNAQVFGKYSIDAYMSLQRRVFEKTVSQSNPLFGDHFIFHAPFARLPLKLMQQIIIDIHKKNPNYFEKLPFSRDVLTEDFKLNPQFYHLPDEILIPEHLKEFLIKDIDSNEKSKEILVWLKNFLQSKILPPLQIPSMFGNMYSASIWAQLLYILENQVNENDIIYFGSYGSGALAVSGYLKVQPNFRKALNPRLNLIRIAQEKKAISFETYLLFKKGIYHSTRNWIKIQTVPNTLNYGFILNFCDCGCILPQMPPLNYCPQNHNGFHRLFFPMLGVIGEILPYNRQDLSPLFQGYYLFEGTPKIGEIIEFHLDRMEQQPYVYEKSRNPLNWIPIYRLSPTSPYKDIISSEIQFSAMDISTISEVS